MLKVTEFLHRSRSSEICGVGGKVGASNFIGAELWLGQSKVTEIAPVHTMGLMPAQIKVFLKEILTAFSGQVSGASVTQFEGQKELSPDFCPLRPCPLHD